MQKGEDYKTIYLFFAKTSSIPISLQALGNFS